MHSKRQQRGMTFWGLSFVLGILAFFLFILFKLIPPYMEDFKVRGALDSLSRQADVGGMSKGDIAEALRKRFEIDNVDSIKLGTDLTVETRGRAKVIRIRYDNVVPVLGNVSLLLEFDHSKEVRSSGE